MGWEKTFTSDGTDKGLISKIYKQHTQLTNIKTNNPIKKMGKRFKYTFLQRRHTDGQKAHKKKLNMINSQRNANQNYNELSPDTSQDGHHQEAHKQ